MKHLVCIQKLLTGTAQTLLEQPPDEFSTQVTPGEVSVVVGLEVVSHAPLPRVAAGHLDANSVSEQADGGAAGGLAEAYSGRGGSCQLDGIINAQVLQLNQFTVRHPVLHAETDMSVSIRVTPAPLHVCFIIRSTFRGSVRAFCKQMEETLKSHPTQGQKLFYQQQ